MDLKALLIKLTIEQKEKLIRLLTTGEMNSSTDKAISYSKCGSFHLVKNGKSKGRNILFAKIVAKFGIHINFEYPF